MASDLVITARITQTGASSRHIGLALSHCRWNLQLRRFYRFPEIYDADEVVHMLDHGNIVGNKKV